MSEDDNDVAGNPNRFDFFRVMRDLERGSPQKPRIGNNAWYSESRVMVKCRIDILCSC